MKKYIFYLLIIALLFPIPVIAQEDFVASTGELQEEYAKGIVLDVLSEELDMEIGAGLISDQQLLEIEITSGPFRGQVFTTENVTSDNPAYDLWLSKGDKVLLYIEALDGKLINGYVMDFARDTVLYLLIALFILSLLVIGRMQGFKAVFTLGFTLLFIAKFMLPMLFKGYNPVLLALLTGVVVTAFTLLIIGGVTKKSFAAIIGTGGGLLIAAVISIIVGKVTNLRGLSGEEAQMLLYIPQEIQFDFQGLLFAGIMIGALGAVMDVSISIASAMEEIRTVAQRLSFKELFKSGMNVGKDVMGTMSNTLILAYTGTSIPLLLLMMAYEQPFIKLINMDFLATELVRALSGSIGLILAIPITAFVAAILMRPKAKDTRDTLANKEISY